MAWQSLKHRKPLIVAAAAAALLIAAACTSPAKDTPVPATDATATGIPDASPAAAETPSPVTVVNPAVTVTIPTGDIPAQVADLTLDEIVQAHEQLLVALYRDTVPSVVRITAVSAGGAAGEGSGFVWDDDGNIVTNFHVVQGARTISVFFKDGSEFDATIVGTDPDADLAVIRIDASPAYLRPADLGDSSTVQTGQMAIAIGNPFGEDFTMTTGIVSAVGRGIESGFGSYTIPAVIQTDAAINPGNSGGPLLDRQGRVIGINTQIRSDSRQNSGVGFAVPVDLIKRVVPSLIEDGSYEYAYLGISGRSIDNAVREGAGFGPEVKGVLLGQVSPGGPADTAGLRGSDRTVRVNGQQIEVGGDVVLAVEGNAVTAMEGLIGYLALTTSPGDRVDLDILRGGEVTVVTVTLGARPD
jgi:2-alkenal reductase